MAVNVYVFDRAPAALSITRMIAALCLMNDIERKAKKTLSSKAHVCAA